MRSRRLGPTTRTLILCSLGLASGVVLTASTVVSVRAADSAAREVADRVVPAQAALRDTWTASATGQESFLAVLQTQDPVKRATALAAAQASGQTQNAAWSAYLQHALDRPGERALQQSYTTASAESVKLAAGILGMKPSDPAYAARLASERRESARVVTALSSLDSKIYAPMIRTRLDAIASGINGARNVVYLVFAALALVFIAVSAWLLRGARRDDRRMIDNARAMTAEAQYSRLETSLQRGLEMEPTEESAYDVIAQALTIVDPDVPSEMLLADSSRAHFRQVFSTAPGADAACPVGTPGDCPATMSGQAQFFKNSSDLDTCPCLRGRGDAVWALCVPVNIAGRTTGVLHMQRAVEFPPADTRGWELIAHKAGDRLGMLRAFARSETQAHTDPLTGLINRRSLEGRTRDLIDEGLPFVVAYCDLDHFKLLNDVHGHDTGDRALRLFARVLRDSVRPNDIPVRYGGEEFVAVLPDCSVENAVVVIERVRSRLHDELAGGSVPPFTASFGLAASETGVTFGETVEAADQALLRAKREGRDRIVIADAAPADAATTAAKRLSRSFVTVGQADEREPEVLDAGDGGEEGIGADRLDDV